MANSSIAVGCKIYVVDKQSKWYRNSGTVDKLIWQSMLDGSEMLASAICALDNVVNKVELKAEQVGLC